MIRWSDTDTLGNDIWTVWRWGGGIIVGYQKSCSLPVWSAWRVKRDITHRG